jgi:lipoprotein NlpD
MGVAAVCLTACANRPAAPIEEREGGGIARPEQRYTVLRGDTLYSIAFRHGLDYRRLAAANDIPLPYVIYPGQTLRLAEADVAAVTRPPSRPAATAIAKSDTAAKSSATRKQAEEERPARAAATADPPAAGSEPPVRSEPARARPPLVTAGDLPDPAVDGWRWPAEGRVARGFDGNLHKGIDIAGDRGDPVRATAAGRVVYAGSGIAGYGLMLILRHNDEYLSAYGHNDSLLVEEGDVVRAGQVIARRGSTGTDGVKLHFEIRRRGRPVDPRGLLPGR